MLSFEGTPEQLGELYQALGQAQAEIGGGMKKTREVNAGKYSYSYLELGPMLAASVGPLAKHGLTLFQMPTQTEHGFALVTVLGHKGGASVRMSLPASMSDRESIQDLGKKITYLRRYAWQSLLAIAGEEDTDGVGEGGQPLPAQSGQPKGGRETVKAARQQGPTPEQKRERLKAAMEKERIRIGDATFALVVGDERPATLGEAEALLARLREVPDPVEDDGEDYDDSPEMRDHPPWEKYTEEEGRA